MSTTQDVKGGKILFKGYVMYFQKTTATYTMEEILFCFQYIGFLFQFFKIPGILKDAKDTNVISYSVIHLTSPFPDFQRCVNLSAALEVFVINNVSEFFHVC